MDERITHDEARRLKQFEMVEAEYDRFRQVIGSLRVELNKSREVAKLAQRALDDTTAKCVGLQAERDRLRELLSQVFDGYENDMQRTPELLEAVRKEVLDG